MLGKLDRDLFTWRVMRHERENQDFIHYRKRIDGILTNATTGPAFTDVNLDSITFSRRRSRLVDLRLRTDGTRTRVVELVGRYETLRRSRQRDDRRREPIEYSVVLWVTASLDGCALVDLSWSNIRWSRHVLELE